MCLKSFALCSTLHLHKSLLHPLPIFGCNFEEISMKVKIWTNTIVSICDWLPGLPEVAYRVSGKTGKASWPFFALSVFHGYGLSNFKIKKNHSI